MRPVLPAFAALALSACVASAPHPVAATLDPTLLRVSMSDGSTCLGPAPAGVGQTGWSGRLQGCASADAYTVALARGGNPVRYVLEEVLGALGMDGVLAPVATVTITGADGVVRTFASPPGA